MGLALEEPQLSLGAKGMRIQTPYNENYGTCAYAHAWLRIMAETVDPDEVTQLLGVEPSRIQRRGDLQEGTSGVLQNGGWFLSTEGVVDSKDARHHLDWLLERVAGKREAFLRLHERGYRIDVCVRWNSRSGHGGPTLSPPQMQALAELEIELWFDIYVGHLSV